MYILYICINLTLKLSLAANDKGRVDCSHPDTSDTPRLFTRTNEVTRLMSNILVQYLMSHK